MNTKKQVKKIKKVSINLPEREVELLTLYAKEVGISRPEAVHRIVRTFLRQYKEKRGESALQPKNQLDLFDSIQIDIFNNTSKTFE